MRFTRWRRRRFFALLEESGSVRMACELSGTGLGCVYRLRRTEAGFVAKMEAAKVKADARLGARPACDSPTPNPSPEGEGLEEGLVIRRGIGGRLRVMAAGNHWWSSRHDAVFLGHLRMTGNIAASARAAGFTPKSAWNRRARLPSFARAWDSALAEAESNIETRLTAEMLRGTAGMEAEAQIPAMAAALEQPVDIWAAIWLLGHFQRKAAAQERERRAAWRSG